MSDRVIFDDRLEVKDKGIVKQIISREQLANEIVQAKWWSLQTGLLQTGESFNRSSMSLTEAMDLAKNDGKWPEVSRKMVSDISAQLVT